MTSIGIASLIWTLYKSEASNPLKVNSEILLNYLLIKLTNVLKETNNKFSFGEFLYNIN